MAKAKQINENKMLVKEVRDWISGYAGKIIAIRTPEEAYHLVFTDGGVAVKEGDYPSCQAYYRGPEEEIIKMLSNEKIEYVFLVQDGNYYPQVLGFLYGSDLNTFLKNNYYTYKMWGGEISFEEFKVFKDNLTMIYILKRLPRSMESPKNTGKHL